MQSHKLVEAMFDEDDIFCPPSFEEQIYYDESMPPIYDDYCDDMYAIKNSDNRRSNSWRDDNDATMEIKVSSR